MDEVDREREIIIEYKLSNSAYIVDMHGNIDWYTDRNIDSNRFCSSNIVYIAWRVNKWSC